MLVYKLTFLKLVYLLQIDLDDLDDDYETFQVLNPPFTLQHSITP